MNRPESAYTRAFVRSWVNATVDWADERSGDYISGNHFVCLTTALWSLLQRCAFLGYTEAELSRMPMNNRIVLCGFDPFGPIPSEITAESRG